MGWNNVENKYFSGQGVVLMGRRGTNGKPLGLRPVGNVSALEIAIETATLEHKESQSGQRAIDLRLTTETNANLNITMESFDRKNFEIALRGTQADLPAAAVTDEPLKGYPGLVTALDYIKVSSLTLALGEDGSGTALDEYVDDETPWDYKVNLEAGSIQFNDDGATVANLGQSASAITVGATTDITIGTHDYQPGSKVYLTGFTGADAGNVNGQTAAVQTVDANGITVNIDTTGDTITFTGGKVFGVEGEGAGFDFAASYSYAAQSIVDALVLGAQELYLRFEGLNTARENEPVVVEVFKFLVDPLQTLGLISDEVQAFAMEGSVLADPLRATGSKFFKIQQVA